MHLCHSGHWQINYIVLMTKEGSTKIVHFVTHGAGVLMLRCDHLSHYSEYSMHYLPQYQNKAHYLQLYYNDHNAVFLCRFYSIMGLLICKYESFWQDISLWYKWALLTRSVFTVSFLLIWRPRLYRWRAAKFDLGFVLMAIDQWCFNFWTQW